MNKTKKRLIWFAVWVAAMAVAAFYLVPKFSRADSQEIVVSNFAAYDLARAATNDPNNVYLLVHPGTELHDYEPSPEDLVKIHNAKLFIYNGGESEDWVEKILASGSFDDIKTARMMDMVELKNEEIVEGMAADDEGEEEYDEHIWTSPRNMITLLDGISAAIRDAGIKIDDKKQSEYREALETLDGDIRDTVAHAARKELIFGDRFPFRYFVDEYGLSYYAAFPGCAEQTDTNGAKVAFLANKIIEDKIPVVLKLELSFGSIATVLSDETGAKVLELHAAHNISADDFASGVTYVDIMRRNLEVLNEALN